MHTCSGFWKQTVCTLSTFTKRTSKQWECCIVSSHVFRVVSWTFSNVLSEKTKILVQTEMT